MYTSAKLNSTLRSVQFFETVQAHDGCQFKLKENLKNQMQDADASAVVVLILGVPGASERSRLIPGIEISPPKSFDNSIRTIESHDPRWNGQ